MAAQNESAPPVTLNAAALASRRRRTKKAAAAPASRTTRAGNRRYGPLSALRTHPKAPYKTDLPWKTLRARNGAGPGQTEDKEDDEDDREPTHAADLHLSGQVTRPAGLRRRRRGRRRAADLDLLQQHLADGNMGSAPSTSLSGFVSGAAWPAACRRGRPAAHREVDHDAAARDAGHGDVGRVGELEEPRYRRGELDLEDRPPQAAHRGDDVAGEGGRRLDEQLLRAAPCEEGLPSRGADRAGPA